jgi:hypothetical protein
LQEQINLAPMLTKPQAKKIAQCLSMMRIIKKAKPAMEEDRETLAAFNETNDLINDLVSGLDNVSHKKVIIMFAREKQRGAATKKNE